MNKTLMTFLAAACSFIAVSSDAQDAPKLRSWAEYHSIMWIGDSVWKDPIRVPLFFQRLCEMGIDTAMVYGANDPKPLVENHFPYYVENIVNKGLCLKFNSKVTDWDKFVTDWSRNGRPESAFVRDYSLDDPAWNDWAATEVRTVVQKNAAHHPLAYNLRDELSVTCSANPFDYDFSPITLAEFQKWLKTQYPDLAALNREWETQFGSWDEVRPFSTDQIKNRMASGEAIPRGKPDWQAVQAIRFVPGEAIKSPTRWNLAPWCDFRTYMDMSLARALDRQRKVAHEKDPQTPVGIEGTQMPSAFGGYDLWRLSQVLDWVEPYDIGNAREIFGSFMPGKPIMTTVFESQTNPASRRLWHLLLEGDRGCIIWWSEDCIDWSSKDYALTPKANALKPVLNELRSPLATLFLRARKEFDPIGIYYSQPSIQVNWLIESTPDGSTWQRRFSSFEADNNRMLRVRDAWMKAFQDLGYSPKFISPDQFASSKGAGLAALILPDVLAAGAVEQALMAQLITNSATIVAYDGTPCLFDEHGKLRSSGGGIGSSAPIGSAERSSMAKKGLISHHDGDVAGYIRSRLAPKPDFAWAEWIQSQFTLPREVVLPLEARARIHRFALGKARLIAIERNIDYQMSEDLKQAGGNEELEKPAELEAKLSTTAHVYDLRTGKYLGKTDRIAFRLDPWQPSLFALLKKEVEPGKLQDYLKQAK